jgi:hypothetical protein
MLITYNTRDVNNVEPNLEEIEKIMSYYIAQLEILNKSILAFATSKSFNDLSNLNSILDNFNVMSNQTSEQTLENEELNSIIENLNIKS